MTQTHPTTSAQPSAQPAPPRQRPATAAPKTGFDAATRSDRGPRDTNEDASLATSWYLVVADGVSGAPAGEHASRLAVAATTSVLEAAEANRSALVGDLLLAVFDRARTALIDHVDEHPSHDGLATTLSVAVVEPGPDGALVSIAWVGDSPVWCVRQGTDGATIDQVGGDPASVDGSLSSWISNSSSRSPRIGSTVIDTGDTVVVASDGIEALTPAAVAAIVSSATDPVDAAAQLVTEALGIGATDNVTVSVGTVWDDRPLLTPTAPASLAGR